MVQSNGRIGGKQGAGEPSCLLQNIRGQSKAISASGGWSRESTITMFIGTQFSSLSICSVTWPFLQRIALHCEITMIDPFAYSNKAGPDTTLINGFKMVSHCGF